MPLAGGNLTTRTGHQILTEIVIAAQCPHAEHYALPLACIMQKAKRLVASKWFLHSYIITTRGVVEKTLL